LSADNDILESLQQSVLDAASSAKPLKLVGGNSKSFLGSAENGEPLSVAPHRGIVNYEPKELVITARAGTALRDVERTLAAQQQRLAFEPPHFGDDATLGGTIACGLSGPARPYAGSARDFVLGVRMLNGRGEDLRFGGEVMKNVAGYDVSRLMCGAMGTLGLLLEISLKVLPRPEHEITLVQERTPQEAIRVVNTWAAKPIPLTASCYDGLHLYVRISGVAEAVAAGKDLVGGTELPDGDTIWHDIREQRHAFFDSKRPLWRLSLPPRTAPLALPGKELIDWGGAQRWLLSDAPKASIRRIVAEHGGHATLFRRGEDSERFHPLPDTLLKLHRRLKQAFDPNAIFNPGRLYPEF
jgi:glycolate oxidase FAD binding subunit